jgi:hypothetical protein
MNGRGRTGLGIVTGAVSGSLEVLDFDDPETFARFIQTGHAVGMGDLLDRIAIGFEEETPNGGRHLAYRCPTIEGNRKLALRPKLPEEMRDPHDLTKVLIETRGEGGYVVTAPSHGRVHPSGRPYRLLRGGFATIANITPEERELLFGLAQSFDAIPKRPPLDPQTRRREHPDDGDRPGDVCNRTKTWDEILEPYGWCCIYTRGNTRYWRRPGKDRGISATTGHSDADTLCVFSTSTPFEIAPTTYSKFGAWAVLNHGGDFRVAAGALCKSSRSSWSSNGSNGSYSIQGSVASVAFVAPQWPSPLAEAAFHGLAGDFVRLVDPHTEADPVAILLDFLIEFGNVIGRSAYFVAEADRHYANLFVALVGMSSKGRKGSSHGQVRARFRLVDESWAVDRQQSGLSSGEGLIWAVRDEIVKREPIRKQRRVTGYQDVMVDPGVEDKRLLAVEAELASTLRVLGRDGNTLSAQIRQAWDTGTLRTLTKNTPAKATDAHISILGHITRDELRRYLDRTEAGNGFANRFLWACVCRSKLLPHGGHLEEMDFAPILKRLREAVEFARKGGQILRDHRANALWVERYPRLSEGLPGLLGAVTSRAEAQVMRIAMLYGLLDRSGRIECDHLKAAFEVWRYSLDSARFIFGDALGDPIADELLRQLRANPKGLTRTEIRDLFHRHQSAQLGRALASLAELGLVKLVLEKTGGRSAERWIAIMPCDQSDQSSRG